MPIKKNQPERVKILIQAKRYTRRTPKKKALMAKYYALLDEQINEILKANPHFPLGGILVIQANMLYQDQALAEAQLKHHDKKNN